MWQAGSEQAFVSLLKLSMTFFMKETGKYEIVKEFTSNEKNACFVSVKMIFSRKIFILNILKKS
jgi:hypothetical protein